jgi:hypothetical protein
MKYVVMKNEDGKEEIFIFPRNLNHDDFAMAAGSVKRRDPNKHHTYWERHHCTPVAAGFFSAGKCTGRSETLNLDSRGRVDELLITG